MHGWAIIPFSKENNTIIIIFLLIGPLVYKATWNCIVVSRPISGLKGVWVGGEEMTSCPQTTNRKYIHTYIVFKVFLERSLTSGHNHFKKASQGHPFVFYTENCP